MGFLLNAGKKTVGALEAIRQAIVPITDPLLDRLAGPRVTPESATAAGMRGVGMDAQAGMSTEQPYRAPALVRVALLLVAVLPVGAALAPAAAVATGGAHVVPSRHVQV